MGSLLMASCCCVPCPECGGLGTPGHVHVTLSGIVPWRGWWIVPLSVDVNGLFTLAQQKPGWPCRWMREIAATGQINVNTLLTECDEPPAPGVVGDFNVEALELRLERISGGWSLAVVVRSTTGNELYLFAGFAAVASGCGPAVIYTSAPNTCVQNVYAAHGGVASVAP